MQMDSTFDTEMLQRELKQLDDERKTVDFDIQESLNGLLTHSAALSMSLDGKKLTSTNNGLSQSIHRLEDFSASLEALANNVQRLNQQTESCWHVSDRLSYLVRQLDSRQSRVQEAISCCDSIINVKMYRSELEAAIERNELPAAVAISVKARDLESMLDEDNEELKALKTAEEVVRVLVKQSFSRAIEENNMKDVMAACRLLQPMNLETEVRDNFLEYAEKHILIGIDADIASSISADEAADASTGYAQALSNIFNSAYVIIQNYLPIVVQGLERSQGDVLFVRRLHARVEKESSIILRRYLKFRNVREKISKFKALAVSSAYSSSNDAVIRFALRTSFWIHQT